MAKKLIKSPEQELAYHESQMDACEMSYVEHAHACGVIFNKKKPQVDHGEWLEWLKENFTRSSRTAQVYMDIASAFPKAKAIEFKTIEEAKCAAAAHLKQDSPVKTTISQPKRGELLVDRGVTELAKPAAPSENGSPSDWKKDRQAIVKTAQAMQRMVDDLNEVHPFTTQAPTLDLQVMFAEIQTNPDTAVCLLQQVERLMKEIV